MNWDAAVKAMDAALVTAFGSASRGMTVLLFPQDGSNRIALNAIPEQPGVGEDSPVGVESDAPNVVRLFVRPEGLVRYPSKGDTIMINNSNYAILNVSADLSGALVLRLRAQ